MNSIYETVAIASSLAESQGQEYTPTYHNTAVLSYETEAAIPNFISMVTPMFPNPYDELPEQIAPPPPDNTVTTISTKYLQALESLAKVAIEHMSAEQVKQIFSQMYV